MFVLVIGTDQTVNSRSPEVAYLIISKVLVRSISAHHRQILVLFGFPSEQLPYQGKGSLGGDFMTPEKESHTKGTSGEIRPPPRTVNSGDLQTVQTE